LVASYIIHVKQGVWIELWVVLNKQWLPRDA